MIPTYQNPYSSVYTGAYPSSMQITRVNGENGAKAFTMGPSSSALLLDENEPIVWLKQTDGAGYPTITPYKIEPYVKEPEPDYKDLLARIERLEGSLNAKSNNSNAGRKQQNTNNAQ